MDIVEVFGFSDEATAKEYLLDRIALDNGAGETFKPSDSWAYRWFPPGFGANTPAMNDAGTNSADLENGSPRDASDGERELIDFIAEPESGGNYDAYFGRANNTNSPRLTTMSLKELRKFQDDYVKGGAESSAAGRYQIIRSTLDSLIQKLDLRKSSTQFSPKVQDQMAIKLLEGRGLRRYQAGEISTDSFANSLAMEWAALPVVTPTTRDGVLIHPGFSYYSGVGSNRALVGVASFRQAVEGAR